MTNSGLLIYILVFFSCSILILPSSESKHQPQLKVQPNKQVAMFVFGDSVFDCGNNNFLNSSRANFPPYGETFFEYPTGRFCDGRIIPDFAASNVGLPLWRPYLERGNRSFTVGANFASAGAGVLVETNPLTLNLEIQTGYFMEVATTLKQQLGEEEANSLIRNAIYFSSFGGVDYMAFGSGSSNVIEAQMQDYVDMVIGNFTNSVKAIYEMGGRKFAFQNVGPLGCQPSQKQTYISGHDCVPLFQILATMHNDALSSVAEDLASKLPGFKYLIFDYFNTVMDRTQNPTKYGRGRRLLWHWDASRRGCGKTTSTYELCSDPSEYVYFDGGHPSESCNAQLIQLLWNGTTNATWPINISQLYELDVDINIFSE